MLSLKLSSLDNIVGFFVGFPVVVLIPILSSWYNVFYWTCFHLMFGTWCGSDCISSRVLIFTLSAGITKKKKKKKKKKNLWWSSANSARSVNLESCRQIMILLNIETRLFGQGHRRFYPFREYQPLRPLVRPIVLHTSTFRQNQNINFEFCLQENDPIFRALRKNVSEFVIVYDIEVMCYNMASCLITKSRRLTSTDGGTACNVLGIKTLQHDFVIECFRCNEGWITLGNSW